MFKRIYCSDDLLISFSQEIRPRTVGTQNSKVVADKNLNEKKEGFQSALKEIVEMKDESNPTI